MRLSKIFGTKGSITLESNGIFIFVRGKKWRFIFPGFSDIVGKKAMFKDFFHALRTGQEPQYNLALAKRDLEFIEKAYKTAWSWTIVYLCARFWKNTHNGRNDIIINIHFLLAIFSLFIVKKPHRRTASPTFFALTKKTSCA